MISSANNTTIASGNGTHSLVLASRQVTGDSLGDGRLFSHAEDARHGCVCVLMAGWCRLRGNDGVEMMEVEVAVGVEVEVRVELSGSKSGKQKPGDRLVELGGWYWQALRSCDESPHSPV